MNFFFTGEKFSFPFSLLQQCFCSSQNWELQPSIYYEKEIFRRKIRLLNYNNRAATKYFILTGTYNVIPVISLTYSRQ